MSTNILGNPETLRKFWCGPFTDLMIKLTGEYGPEYEAELNRFLRKQPCWESVVHNIDCDADPLVLQEFTLVEHIKQGNHLWSSDAIRLFTPDRLPEPQERNKFPTIRQVMDWVGNSTACNTNVLDYMLRFPHLIPEEWKKYQILFLGTVLGIGHFKEVRCLRWHEVNWEWHHLADINEWRNNSSYGEYRIAEWLE